MTAEGQNINGEEPYIKHEEFEENSEMQSALAPVVLDNLIDLGFDESTELHVEYFFYTDTIAKAEVLGAELKKLGYYVWSGPASRGDEFLINGWTTRMSMDTESLIRWVNTMSTLGYSLDCKFDGWGTSEQMQGDVDDMMSDL